MFAIFSEKNRSHTFPFEPVSAKICASAKKSFEKVAVFPKKSLEKVAGFRKSPLKKLSVWEAAHSFFFAHYKNITEKSVVGDSMGVIKQSMDRIETDTIHFSCQHMVTGSSPPLALPLGELSPQVTERVLQPFSAEKDTGAYVRGVLSFGMVIVYPPRPRCDRPPLPEGKARDACTLLRSATSPGGRGKG